MQPPRNTTEINNKTKAIDTLKLVPHFARSIHFNYLNILNNVAAIKKELTGKIDVVNDHRFMLIPKKYSYKETYIRKDVFEAFLRMAQHAKKDSLRLIIVSGIRTFDQQKELWEKKWMQTLVTERNDIKIATTILKYSAMPMTSRHHWGTEIDINMVKMKYYQSPEGKKVYNWLKTNAPKYGFHQVYTPKNGNNRQGYENEPWHWSYMPLAKQYLEQYNQYMTYQDFSGFTGAHLAQELKIIEHYVNGITSQQQYAKPKSNSPTTK